MATAEMLEKVKKALGIEGTYQDDTITEYIDEVTEFLKDAGIAESRITAGLVARGVSDLWSYGAGNGKLSEYFMMRAKQIALKGAAANG
jgi:hypothetical protein